MQRILPINVCEFLVCKFLVLRHFQSYHRRSSICIINNCFTIINPKTRILFLLIFFVFWSQQPLGLPLKWLLSPQLYNQRYSHVYQNICVAHNINYHNGIQNLKIEKKKETVIFFPF